MPQISVDFSDAPDFSLIPEGKYYVEVVEADVTTSQNGDPMMKVQLEITEEGEFQGRKLFDNMMLVGNGLGITKRNLGILLGDVPDGEFSFDTDDLLGQEAQVLVKHRVWEEANGGDGEARADVSKYYAIKGGASPTDDLEKMFD